MTERQYNTNDLLHELIRQREADHTATPDLPPLTERVEQDLLAKANEVGTPVLVPQETSAFNAATAVVERSTPLSTPSRSSHQGLIAFVRRHPLATFGVALGLGYAMARRR